MIDDGPFSSSQGRSLSGLPFLRLSLLQATDGVTSLALCPQVVSQAPQHFRSSETQSACGGCFARPANLSALSVPLTPACPGRHTMQKAIQVLVGILPSICHNAFEVTLFMAAFTHSPLAFFFFWGAVVHEIVGGAISLQVRQYKSQNIY